MFDEKYSQLFLSTRNSKDNEETNEQNDIEEKKDEEIETS